MSDGASETNGIKHSVVVHLLGRLERAEIKKNAIQADFRTIYDDGESKGIPRKALKRLFNRAKVDPAERAQQDLFDAVLERAAGLGDTAPTFDEAAGAYAIPQGIEDEERDEGDQSDSAPPPPAPPKAEKAASGKGRGAKAKDKPKAGGDKPKANGHANGHAAEPPVASTMTETTLAKIEEEGKHAGAKGLSLDKNPWPEGGQGHERWGAGWLKGRAVHDFAPAPTAKPPVPAEDGPAPTFE